jgi:flavin reductase (DIM6/NTAB) family NADH-FMN oxidoreductase RutF
MRPCDIAQLAFKPFATNDVVLVVGEDRAVHEVALGGAGRFESLPTLALFVMPGSAYLIGSHLTVNLLPAARRHEMGMPFENSDSVRSPRIAESRLSFECVVLTTGTLDGEHAQKGIVVAHVLATHQRWPRGCAIT